MNQKALDHNYDVIRLKQLLSECFFYPGYGGELYRSGAELLESLYASPMQAMKLLPKIRHAWKMIEWEAAKYDKLMRSPYPTEEAVHVLYRQELTRYREMLFMTASSCVYLILMSEGPEAARNLKWEENAGLQKWFRAVNTEFLPALCQTVEPETGWIIRKRSDGGFSLTYEPQEEQLEIVASLNQEPFGACAAFYPDSYVSEEADVPVCWGVGNILSVELPDALTLLQGDVITALRCPKTEELAGKLPAPFSCAKILADGQPFIISPEELLLAMNRWQSGE